jgi:hypothetical protein
LIPPSTTYDAGRACRSDVLIHQTYHWLELPKDGVDFPGPGSRTPAAAFQNADTMTQLGNALIGLDIDNCVPTEPKRTVFPNELRACLAAPPAP